MSDFDDVGAFHKKFNLDNVTQFGAGPRIVNKDLMSFRIKFMEEELQEFKDGAAEGDDAKMFDALVDLVYVAMGSAHVLGYPWGVGWREVQSANMAKERCRIDHKYVGDGVEACTDTNPDGRCGAPKEKHSLRGNLNDVIKPPGWTAPNIRAILKRHGFV